MFIGSDLNDSEDAISFGDYSDRWINTYMRYRDSRVCREKRFIRIQVFRVQALACVFGQRQPKGCNLNAVWHGITLFPDRLLA
jgi:hypothetical protein